MAGVALPLIVDRLIVQPALNKALGPEAFGGLIWALGLTTMIGSVTGNGFAILLMRDTARLDPAGKRRAFSTSLLLTAVIAPIVLLGSAFLSMPFATPSVQENRWAIYLTLSAFALFRTIEINLNANLRIQRRFRAIFTLRLIEAAALSVNLLVLANPSFWAIGMVYISSSVLPLICNIVYSRDVVGVTNSVDRQTIKWLMSGWLAGSLITLLDQSQVYLSRIVLGIVTDGEQVAYFYAGIAISNIFVLPVTVMGQVILSVLGGKRDFALRGLRATGYLGLVLLTAGVTSALAWFAGARIVDALYPDLAPQTLTFYGWMVLSCGAKVQFLLLRPIAIKYAPLWPTTCLIAATLLLQVVLLILWARSEDAAGAAKAIGISGLISSAAWTVYYAWICIKAKGKPTLISRGKNNDSA